MEETGHGKAADFPAGLIEDLRLAGHLTSAF
jgi:hypothetical protein